MAVGADFSRAQRLCHVLRIVCCTELDQDIEVAKIGLVGIGGDRFDSLFNI